MMQTVCSVKGAMRGYAGVFGLRFMSSALACTLEEQLSQRPWLQLLQVPGLGRGLFATKDIEQGMLVHEELPMLCAPSPQALDTTCHQCLHPIASSAAFKLCGLRTSSSNVSVGGNRLVFCSPSCADEAQQEWATAAAGCHFALLQQACREAGQKFPLLAARLACLQLQQEQRHQPTSSTSSTGRSAGTSEATSAAPAAAGGASVRGDARSQLRLLCFANLAEPPLPWVEMYHLMLQGLRPLCASTDWPQLTPAVLDQRFPLAWFLDVMSRLHLNVFRVDTVPLLDASDPSALLQAAAATLTPASAPSHHTGSALYLLASMLNHSCEPSLDTHFPRNNAAAAFTAARNIAAGEQLTISYIDAGQTMSQRQEALLWGYGFHCTCPRCLEEEQAEEAKGPTHRSVSQPWSDQ